jgi:hypothetical protein
MCTQQYSLYTDYATNVQLRYCSVSYEIGLLGATDQRCIKFSLRDANPSSSQLPVREACMCSHQLGSVTHACFGGRGRLKSPWTRTDAQDSNRDTGTPARSVVLSLISILVHILFTSTIIYIYRYILYFSIKQPPRKKSYTSIYICVVAAYEQYLSTCYIYVH